MPDLLLELFCEEIPARMQARAEDDLKRLVTDALVDAGLAYEGARTFSTPRRLTLAVNGVPAASPDTREERKGPRVDAPEKAVEGFLRAAGLVSVDEAEVASDPKKGDFYLAVVEKPGRPAAEVIASIMPDVVRKFPWPKSMRWGTSALRWVRPLQSVLCVFGPETEDTEIVAFEIDGLASSNTTEGHRFMGAGEIAIARLDDYLDKLEAAKVIADPARRRDIILDDAKNLAFAQGLDLVEDEALLREVAGLVEWPVVLMGSFDEAFLQIPPEVIRTTIRANQKCFVLRSGAGLANRFLLVANLEVEDGGDRIVAGNERVIAARLADARFFWEQDLKVPLDRQAEKLAAITYHEQLGSQAERIERLRALARRLAPLVAADPDAADRAASLCKADLVTEMVGEFPELQGLMGRYYAAAGDESDAVAVAIEDHYRPQGPGDAVPSDPVAIAVALADKLDQLAGFWAIDEKPTGSEDPFALRRAALGAIRIVLENDLRLPLLHELFAVEETYSPFIRVTDDLRSRAREVTEHELARIRSQPGNPLMLLGEELLTDWRLGDFQGLLEDNTPQLGYWLVIEDLLAFLADRLKVQLREDGARHDLVDAVFALPGQDDFLMIVRRVEALAAFLDTEDGASLLTAYRRSANILRIEEKKDATSYDGDPDAGGLRAGGGGCADGGDRQCRGRCWRGAGSGRLCRGHVGTRRIARARRCLLRRGHRQCRRSRPARQPAEAPVAHPRRHGCSGRFLARGRLTGGWRKRSLTGGIRGVLLSPCKG